MPLMSRLPHFGLWLSRVSAALRGGRWAGLIVASVLLLGALAQYAAAMSAVDEVASAELRVVVMPESTASTSALLAARHDAEQIARQLAQGGVLADPALDAAIADMTASPNVTAHDVGQALSAANSGSLVTLTARWHTAAGAEKLASAAVSVLTAGGLTSVAEIRMLVPAGALAQVQISRPPGAAQPDASQQEDARRALAARVALSVIAGLLVAAGWGFLVSDRRIKTHSR